jgi:Tfp pilus assembly protein PilX
MKTLRHSQGRSSNGAALMIVLAFVVLLTGLVLAFFASTSTERQLAHASYNDTSGGLLARA